MSTGNLYRSTDSLVNRYNNILFVRFMFNEIFYTVDCTRLNGPFDTLIHVITISHAI